MMHEMKLLLFHKRIRKKEEETDKDGKRKENLFISTLSILMFCKLILSLIVYFYEMCVNKNFS
jgi:hypothetical protein